ITNHFGYPVGRYDGMGISYSHEEELLGTGGAVRKALPQFFSNEPFWVIYGDNLLDVDLQGMERVFHEKPAQMVLGLYRHPHPEMASQVRWARTGQVTFFEEKPSMLIDEP